MEKADTVIECNAYNSVQNMDYGLLFLVTGQSQFNLMSVALHTHVGPITNQNCY